MKTPCEFSQSETDTIAKVPPAANCASGDAVPDNSTKFQLIPLNSSLERTEAVDKEQPTRKARSGTFLEKISPSQHSQLMVWLADHSYDEITELVAAQPPTGFGIKVGKTTLCRFHKAHFYEIDQLRHEHIESRASEMLHHPDGPDYRAMLRDSHTQLLLERLWELLSRPVQSVDDLKKLTVIAEKMKSLDRDKEMLEELQKEKRQLGLNQLFTSLSVKSAQSNP